MATALDRLLDRAHLTPPALVLPPEVRAELEAVFGDSIRPDLVVVRAGHVPGIPHPRAFALPRLIYLGRDPGIVPVSGEPGRFRATPTLVHEFVHVWQARHRGPRYMAESLRDQLLTGRRAYDWAWHLDRLGPGGRWRDLPVEAQAQFVGHAHAAGGTAVGRHPLLVESLAHLRSPGAWPTDGDAGSGSVLS